MTIMHLRWPRVLVFWLLQADPSMGLVPEAQTRRGASPRAL